ncbi:MAG TPA: VWA domain-containing protein [Vicinamibacterales bacterium]|nr:VWA domain-containing protein [Vicinamibacterales bacterium]
MHARQAASQQAPPVIRSQITLVPIDVRVVGRDGLPVTDLTERDFTILEDGVPQEIRHFSSRPFTADAAAAAAAPPFRQSIQDDAAAPNRRVVLIVLGRGRHQAVSKYVDGLSRFVTGQLLPQDHVALMAWNRATDFTTDHAAIAAILARYREQHEKIESDLRSWFSGLRAVYASREIPPRIQARVDAVFDDAPELRPRALTPSASSDAGARAVAARVAADEIVRDEIAQAAEGGMLRDMRAEILAALSGMSFEEYVAQAPHILQDIGSLHAAIDYLRYLEGEKHLLFLTENGIDIPLLSGNQGLARIASDARIAVDIVQTGGVASAPPPRVVHSAQATRTVMQPAPSFAAVANQGFSVRDLRMIADVSGGHMMAFKTSAEAFTGIGNAMAFQYLLAYAPSRSAVDGRFRTIEIRTTRPGLNVQYRRGYFASPRIVPLDRRDFVTAGRMRAAAQYGDRIDHIKVDIDEAKPSGDGRTLDIVLKLNVARMSFTEAAGIRTASLDVSLYAVNSGRGRVGESLSRVDLRMTGDAYQRALKDGARVALRLPITAGPRQLKVVVYDYGADLLGTAVRRFGS